MVQFVPVLDVGGTHVSAALVDPDGWQVSATGRFALNADAPADAVLGQFAGAAASLDVPAGAAWGVAMPDPFDYERGVGQFEGVGKFAALRGVDVGAALRARVRGEVVFLNDADAFVLGEWAAGAAGGARRCAGITLGTGIGSGWVVDGSVVDPGVPPGGRMHRMRIAGVPLEDVVSRRAIRRAFAAAGGDPGADVKEIAAAARSGDARAREVLDAAFRALGAVVGPCVTQFAADVLVVGGSMSASWRHFEPAFRSGAGAGALPEIRVSADSDRAPLVGAALHACRAGGG